MSMIQFAEKLKDILFFLMKQFHENTPSPFLLYPSIAIITGQLTLLTSYRIVATFSTKIAILLANCIRIQSKRECLWTLRPGI